MKSGKVKRLQSPLLHEQLEARCSTKNCSRTWSCQVNNTLLCSFCASHQVPTEDESKKKKGPRQ